MKLDKRYLDCGEEYRAVEEEGKFFVEGYALKFNTRSKPIMGKFIEVIDQRALDNADMDNVLGRINHSNDMQNVFARSGVNLVLTVDEVGLFYRAELDAESPRDMQLYRDMQRGLIAKSSFAFATRKGGDKWEKRDGEILRTVLDISKLGDIAPVHNPAYDDTSATVSERSKESCEKFEKEFEKQSKKESEQTRTLNSLDIDDKARLLILKKKK